MRKVLPIFVCVLSIVLFVFGARRQSEHVNTDMHSHDQSAYMGYAKGMARTNFCVIGDRNRMPLYPALMSIFYRDGISDEDFFEIGKNVGIIVALVCLPIVYLILSLVSKAMDAFVGTLITMFTVFAYKAPYFQTEVLFYTINLIFFYLTLSLIRKPKFRTAVLAGLLGGIGHLTKASILPAVLLAALLVGGQGVFVIWSNLQNRKKLWSTDPHSRGILNGLFYMAVFLVCFILVVFPYIRTSKERFGKYF